MKATKKDWLFNKLWWSFKDDIERKSAFYNKDGTFKKGLIKKWSKLKDDTNLNLTKVHKYLKI